jgi:hypothetical protein
MEYAERTTDDVGKGDFINGWRRACLARRWKRRKETWLRPCQGRPSAWEAIETQGIQKLDYESAGCTDRAVHPGDIACPCRCVSPVQDAASKP